MTHQVVVTGMGLVTALGTSHNETWKNLLQGQCGLKEREIFPEHPNLLLGLVEEQPQDFQALILNCLHDALADAELQTVPKDTGVVLGSSRGNQSDIEAIARQDRSLEDWLSIYCASPSLIAAQDLQLEGPILAPRAACATGLWAIAQGADLIRQGLADVVIAGGIESPITPLTIAGFQKMGALSPNGAKPFDLHRTGFVLGEGAAVLILESWRHAAARRKEIYGTVLGFGSSADGYHISAPAPHPHRAIQAVQQALDHSQVDPLTVQFIHAHGTGTQLNDQNEAKIIRHLFPQAPFVMSSKGAIGHTLGASGAIGVALSLMGLKEQMLPPNVGLQTLDPTLGINVLRKPHSGPIENSLCLSFGFGGQNAALMLGRSPSQAPED